MIIGGLLITTTLIIYYLYYPKMSPKGSLGYYKYKWKEISNNYKLIK